MAEDAEDTGSGSELGGDEQVAMGPTYYTCLVCMNIAHWPLVSLCGHHFCGSCIYTWLRYQQRCPYCQNGIEYRSLIPIRYEDVQQHYRPLPREIETVQERAVMPAMGMYLRGHIEYPLEPRPRFKPLPLQLLCQVPQHAVRRVFLAPNLAQRGVTLFIMVLLLAMYLNIFA